jgi:glyoxylase-like metal-dependent hydrolase (beta-lactamase superfamily II)
VSGPELLDDGVVRLGTRFVNWYLVAGDDGVTVVDAGVPGYRRQLEPGLELLGRKLEDVKAILLTHADGDHTGVANAVHDETGSPIHLHPGDAESAHTRGKKKTDESMAAELKHLTAWQLFGHFTLNGGARPPVIDGTKSITAGPMDVPGKPVAIPTPGHTPGHTAFHFPGHGALFVGDLLCTWHPTRGRLGPQTMAFNVSTPQSIQSLDAIEGIEAKLVLPGHGDPWTEGPATAAAKARATAKADGRPGA